MASSGKLEMAAVGKYEAASLKPENIRNDTFVQRLFLTWVYAVVGMGRSGKLRQAELRMPADQATETVSSKFQTLWDEELKLKDNTENKPSLQRALWKAFGTDVIIAGCWKLTWSVFVLLGSFYFVRSLVQFVSLPTKTPNIYNTNSIPNDGVGWILSCAFFLDSILVGTALQRMGDACVRAGIKIRGALMTSVYRKTFKLQNLHGADAGNIVSLVSTDCQKLYEGVQHLHNVWTGPIEALAIIALLLSLTQGIYGLPALGIVFVVLPLQYYFGLLMASYKAETVEVSDARVLRMHEVLLAIKLVKFYVWEKSFSKQIVKVREEEIKLMIKTAKIRTLNLCLVFAIPPVIALVIYATYVFNLGPFDSTFSFTVLSLFNTLRFPLVVLPKALRGVSEGIAAMKRLEILLLEPEFSDPPHSPNVEARFVDAVLTHPSAQDDFKLNIKKLEVKPGEVVAIVGRVGSGKSSIFQAVLNTMKVQSGEVHVGGTIAYVPQTPWVQNLTLKENILFGLPYDDEKYKRTIYSCALELDLQILPKGDQSIAGERGINLSGGQRQRVCLARAAYHECEMVLLDNPLSAVDQHTARHIFDNCIKGMLKDKAVMWITHQLDLLPECDKIGIMDDSGTMVYFGPYNPEALNDHLPVDHLLFATVEAGESGVAVEKPSTVQEAMKVQPEEHRKAFADASTSGRKSFQRSHVPDMTPSDSVYVALKAPEEHEGKEMRTIARVSEDPSVVDPLEQSEEQIEALFSGTVKRLTAQQALMVYVRAGGTLLAMFSLFVFGLTQTVRILGDNWIRYWAADYYHWYVTKDEHGGSSVYLAGYAGFVVLFILLLFTRDITYSIWQIIASTDLHNSLFSRVLNSPMLFFLRTPVGDVLNAFARDQDTLDEALPDTVHMTTIYLMILLTSLAIVTVSIHYYAALTAALFAAFAVMQFVYLPAATVLKRWAGDSASMVFVHVDESLHGMDVIKAFDAVTYFTQENIRRINNNHLAMFNTEQCHLWLAFWCDFFGAILVVATCLFSVGLKDSLGPAPVGLAISNTIQVLVFFTWVVRGMADTVSMWDAVERITTYATAVPTEVDVVSSDPFAKSKLSREAAEPTVSIVTSSTTEVTDADGRISMVDSELAERLDSWPTKGDIVFEKVCLRYFPGGPLALRYVTFHIEHREKIGVVGRTGSGKTTLLMAMFRMFELAYGRILIDGVNIAAVPLREVRRRISIIPQEPVMFKGTIRSNLDPFHQKSDADLWEALRLVHLKEAVEGMPGGVDAVVAEGGSNFSLGQRQLVCMARCVLKETQILVLDEATAAMDLQTDSLIQKTIRKVFKERTTITIAHRLDTIIFSDRVLAMSSGQLKEFDPPDYLLNKPTSMFNALVEDTGPHAAALLRRMAAEGPKDEESDERAEAKKAQESALAAAKLEALEHGDGSKEEEDLKKKAESKEEGPKDEDPVKKGGDEKADPKDGSGSE